MCSDSEAAKRIAVNSLREGCGIPVLPGSDLFGQLRHRGLGHMYCTVNGRTDRAPAYDDMGGALSLYWEA